jgi:hypothetical protein
MAQAETNPAPKTQVVSTSTRMMAIEPTQTVDFDGSLKQLYGRLQLTPAQQSAWAGFEKSVKGYSDQFFAEAPLSAFAGEPAPRQVERMAERMQDRMNTVQGIARAAKTLYAVLDAQQKKTADLYLLASIPVFGNPPTGH